MPKLALRRWSSVESYPLQRQPRFEQRRIVSLANKFSHAAVSFEHPAKGEHHCAECVHWQGPVGQCEIVRPPVRASDWCKKFEERKESEEY